MSGASRPLPNRARWHTQRGSPALRQARLLEFLRGREPSVILASINACADFMENCHQIAKENIPTVQLDRGLMCSFYLQVSVAGVDMDSPELERVPVVQEASSTSLTVRMGRTLCARSSVYCGGSIGRMW